MKAEIKTTCTRRGMSKLHIDFIERDAFDTWAIRFSGDNKAFMDLIGHFHKEGIEHTRWESEACDGKGAWIIDDSVLIRYDNWFDNLKVQLNITLRCKNENIAISKNQPLKTGDYVHHKIYGEGIVL